MRTVVRCDWFGQTRTCGFSKRVVSVYQHGSYCCNTPALCHSTTVSSIVCYLPNGSALLVILLYLVAPVPGAGADNAVAEFKKIQRELESARANHDWSASSVSANDLNQLLNGQPDSMLELARAKVHTGDLIGALHAG
jgi:hypothetical protein